MLESIRKHSKFVMIVLFLLIIPSFVLVGIDSNYFTGKSPVVARVDGKDITQADWDNAHRVESDRVRQQMPDIDGKLLDSPQARYQTLERLVRDQVLLVAAQKMHLQVSDERLAAQLRAIPQIAQLTRADGSLDAQAYRALVGAQGMTPEGFEARMRSDMAVAQVLGGVTDTNFVEPALARLTLDALLQRREVRIARFPASDYAAKVAVSDEALQSYYQSHPAQFQQAEQVDVEYVVLDLTTVKAGITLSEDDLRTYYKENAERLAGPEERRVSHILIAVAQDAPAPEREQAKKRAQELLAQLHKTPERFAELAKRDSQDPGSAPAGGDLGFIGRGVMVKSFEDAVFALSKGAISGLVETDFGYHIIEVTEIKKSQTPSFEAIRAKLEQDLKQQQAQRKFAEVADAFANTVYEQPDGLQDVAQKFKLKLQSASAVTRHPAPGASGPLANERLLEALFRSDSLQNKRNTDAVEIGSNEIAAGRVTNYQPALTLPYEQAKDKARQLYVAERSAALARADGEAKLAAWKAQPASASGLAAAITVARDQPQGQPGALVNAVLQAPIEPLPNWVGVDLGDAGYAVVKFERIASRPAADAEQQRAQAQQYAQIWGTAETLAYYELLKQRYQAQIKVARPSAQEPAADN